MPIDYNDEGYPVNGPDLSKPHCYVAFDGLKIEGYGFIPAIVIEGDGSGVYPMGNPTWKPEDVHDRMPYFWGQTVEECQAACDRANERNGIDKAEAHRIFLSFLAAKGEREERSKRIPDSVRRVVATSALIASQS